MTYTQIYCKEEPYQLIWLTRSYATDTHRHPVTFISSSHAKMVEGKGQKVEQKIEGGNFFEGFCTSPSPR